MATVYTDTATSFVAYDSKMEIGRGLVSPNTNTTFSMALRNIHNQYDVDLGRWDLYLYNGSIQDRKELWGIYYLQ